MAVRDIEMCSIENFKCADKCLAIIIIIIQSYEHAHCKIIIFSSRDLLAILKVKV